jgi:hypothetical protein
MVSVPCGAWGWAWLVLTLLLALGHVGINFGADLPRFLVAENLVLAAIYLAGVAGLLRGSRVAALVAGLVAVYSAGRVSRSIVSPEGQLGELWLQHIPLLALDLAVGLLGVYLGCRC